MLKLHNNYPTTYPCITGHEGGRVQNPPLRIGDAICLIYWNRIKKELHRVLKTLLEKTELLIINLIIDY